MGLVLTAVEPLRRQQRARMRRRPERRVFLAALDAAARMIQVHASAAICMHRTPPRRGLRHVSSSKACAPMTPTDLAPLIHHIYVLGPAVFCAEEWFSCHPARRTQCPSTDVSADTYLSHLSPRHSLLRDHRCAHVELSPGIAFAVYPCAHNTALHAHVHASTETAYREHSHPFSRQRDTKRARW